MADPVDRTVDFTEAALKAHADAAKSSPQRARGRCLFCSEPVEGVFCPPEENDCRDLWERQQHLKKINGR